MTDQWGKSQVSEQRDDVATPHDACTLDQVAESQSTPPLTGNAVVIQHQAEIRAFMESRDFGKDANKIRAILIEFVKFQAGV